MRITVLLFAVFALGGCATPISFLKGRIGEKTYVPAPALKKNRGAIAVYFQSQPCPPTEWRLITEMGPEPEWHSVARAWKPGLEKEKNAEAYGIQFRLCNPIIGVAEPEVRTITVLEQQILRLPIVYR